MFTDTDIIKRKLIFNETTLILQHNYYSAGFKFSNVDKQIN